MEQVRISSAGNRVEVVATERPDIEVSGRAEVTRAGTTTTVTASDRVAILVPEGTDLVIGTTSGRVEVKGRVGSVAITTESGRIDVEHAASVDARCQSARVEIGRADGSCRIHTVSGSVRVQRSGTVDAATESGRIDLGEVRGPASAHCVTGRIDIELSEANDVDAETVSGRITVTVPRHLRVQRVESFDERQPGADCVVLARSVSGQVKIRTQ